MAEMFGLGKSERAEDMMIPGAEEELRLRIFRPRGEVRGAMLHIHGGGWNYGNPELSDVANEALCEPLDVAIASVDYRLAPAHPYPAACDDCEAAAVWLMNNAPREFGTDRLVIGGESAGGHLSAVTTLRMRDRHGFSFRGVNLVAGLYDLSGVPSHTALDGPLLSSAGIESFTDQFVGPGLRHDPDVSPLYADLGGLPPALFTVGTLDPLLDQTLFLYTRWLAAGNPAELEVCAGGPHGFDALSCPEAQRASTQARLPGRLPALSGEKT